MVVYRATDTTLGRQVAIKILPDTFATAPELRARLDRQIYRDGMRLSRSCHVNLVIDFVGLRVSDLNVLRSPRTSASFFLLLHRFNWCSRAIALSTESCSSA